MEAIFTYILKVNALIVLFYLVYQLALSKETFYKHSRWFLLSGLFVSVLLPLFTITRVEYYEVKRVLSNSVETNVPVMMPISSEVVQEPMLTNQEIMFLIYGIICFGFLLKTLFDFFKLFKIIKFSNSEKKNKLVYVNSTLVNTPFSFFNYIIFNEELINPVELQNIMKHEEAHSKQKHSFDTLLAHVFIILFWFNPIVWLYRKCIVQNLEFLADNYAIQHVSDIKQYQKTMLKITLQTQQISIINTFNQSSIKKRIVMLNTNQSNRKNIWKFGIVLPFVTAFMLLFQVETVAQEKVVLVADKIIYKSNLTSIISPTTSNEKIKQLEKEFSDENLKLKISNVRRNSNQEITAIKVSFISKNGEAKDYNVDKNVPIDEFELYKNKNTNDLGDFGFRKPSKNRVSDIDTKEAQAFDKVEIITKNDKTISKFSNNTDSEIDSETTNDENVKNEIERARKEIELAKIEMKNEMKNATPEVKLSKREMERAKVEKERAKRVEEKGEFNGVNSVSNVTFELDNGDTALIYRNNFLKLPGFPSIDFSLEKNKIFIDGKNYGMSSFNSFDHKKIKSVNVLKFTNESSVDGKSLGEYENGFGVYFKTK